MKIQKLLGLPIAAAVLLATSFIAQAAEGEYSFKVHNTTKSMMKKLLVSEDGKKWGDFDLGDGIPAGKAETMVWASHTDNSGCEWWVKAVYADGSETDAVKFDFCEKNLEIEF